MPIPLHEPGAKVAFLWRTWSSLLVSLSAGSARSTWIISLVDQQDVTELKRLGKLAQWGPRFTAQGVRKDAAANAKKTSLRISSSRRL